MLITMNLLKLASLDGKAFQEISLITEPYHTYARKTRSLTAAIIINYPLLC
ncbi:MAG: hypothetical protein ACI9L9_001792 [Marivirga sp.]|jgi:hypothetical protein